MDEHAHYLVVLRRNLQGALDSQRLSDARALLDRLREQDPLSAETRTYELDILTREGRFDEAVPLADQLVELYPGSARVQFQAGMLAHKRGRHEIAESHFREAAAQRPRWRINRWLALTLVALARHDEAEGILLAMVADHAVCRRDLAWLYERKGATARALEAVDAYLKLRPEDRVACAQRERLRARALGPEGVVQELSALEELEEDISPNLLPEYLSGLLLSGRMDEARALVEERRHGLSDRDAVSLGWAAYQALSYDLALDLWLDHFDNGRRSVKLLNSLHKAARLCRREAEVIRVLEEHAPRDPALYGRAKKLRAISEAGQ